MSRASDLAWAKAAAVSVMVAAAIVAMFPSPVGFATAAALVGCVTWEIAKHALSRRPWLVSESRRFEKMLEDGPKTTC